VLVKLIGDFCRKVGEVRCIQKRENSPPDPTLLRLPLALGCSEGSVAGVGYRYPSTASQRVSKLVGLNDDDGGHPRVNTIRTPRASPHHVVTG
jgi:hypothetical protein